MFPPSGRGPVRSRPIRGLPISPSPSPILPRSLNRAQRLQIECLATKSIKLQSSSLFASKSNQPLPRIEHQIEDEPSRSRCKSELNRVAGNSGKQGPLGQGRNKQLACLALLCLSNSLLGDGETGVRRAGGGQRRRCGRLGYYRVRDCTVTAPCGVQWVDATPTALADMPETFSSK